MQRGAAGRPVPAPHDGWAAWKERARVVQQGAASTSDAAVGVIGEVCSGASVAAAGVADSRRVPLVSPASTSPSLSRADYFLRTVPSDRYQGVAAASLVYRQGGRNVGLVYDDSVYGYGLAFNFIAGFTSAGGSVPVVYTFKPDKGNATAAVDKLLEGKASQRNPVDAVFIATNDLVFVADFLKAAAAARLDLPLYGGDSLADVTVSNSVTNTPAAALLPRLTVTAPNPGQEGFRQRFDAFDGGETPFNGFAATAYDAMAAMLRALGAAGAPYAGESVLQQLLRQKFQGVSGPIEFDANGDLKPSSTAYAYLGFTPQGALQLQGLINQPLGNSSSSSSSSSSNTSSSSPPRRALRGVQQ
ncbi:periplasmic binding protein-like I [Scenedesmus sp. NREL 46B-D3]|nr:periplasmic binding protein-like I [Scenedesmus sp. NREL 46B-D3]